MGDQPSRTSGAAIEALIQECTDMARGYFPERTDLECEVLGLRLAIGGLLAGLMDALNVDVRQTVADCLRSFDEAGPPPRLDYPSS